ncbi:MAG TPA: hypothetical protein VNN20_03225 [Thermodesulfobacteriota bacterium]|nr:hypothetical protein [Thermodesulfobacteriota bacterium]
MSKGYGSTEFIPSPIRSGTRSGQALSAVERLTMKKRIKLTVISLHHESFGFLRIN